MENFNEHSENINVTTTDSDTRYLILSGEGTHDTEHQFVMGLSSLKQANIEFDELKKTHYKNTYLYIYEAKLLREE